MLSYNREYCFGVSQLAYLPFSLFIYLPPFAMSSAFPWSNYYGGSVTMGLAPFRPSHVSSPRNVKRLRFSVRPLTWTHCSSSFDQRVTHATTKLCVCQKRRIIYVVTNGLTIDHWRLEFRQCSFNHIIKVSQAPIIHVFWMVLSLRPCYCPLFLSDSGKAVHLEVMFSEPRLSFW